MTARELDALLALQDLDTALDRLRHRRAHLPEREEVAALEQEIVTLEGDVRAVTAGRDEIAERQAAVEADLASTEARIASVNRRLYGGEVRASRELLALSADVDSLKGRASLLEDQVLELMELHEPEDARLTFLSTRLATLGERRQAATSGLAASEATTDEELARIAGERALAAALVPAELLGTYDRLRAQLDGVAVARLVGSRCDGCHLTLPAMQLDSIRHLPEGEAATCDQCGRILVRS